MKIITYLFILALCSCTAITKKTRPPINKTNALLKIADPMTFMDDMDYQGLSEGLLANINHLRSKPEHRMQFGSFVVSSGEYAEGLESLHNALKVSKEDYLKLLQQQFSIYKVYGKDNPGEAFVTSYYAPEIPGSTKKTKKFSAPLYAIPDDMVIVRLGAFSQTYGDHFHKRFCKDKKNCISPDKVGILRGRLVDKKDMASEILPYYSREQIVKTPIKAKILAWVDPIEAFFIQIQGSGFVKLKNGKILQLGYAAQNGHKYVAIGKYLLDVIPLEKMSLQSIEEHLRTLTDQQRDEILDKNPSYVFFKEIATKPVTYFGIETIDGRTIATDKRYFPKGALAYLKFKKPVFTGPEATEPKSYSDSSRFVFDHDTGGAIKGGGRLDLYWGAGDVAKQSAGVIKHLGELYYLLPKSLEVIQPKSPTKDLP